MSVVAFDTLKLARRLEGAGFSREQADGTAAALADTPTAEIATKGDLFELKAELKSDISELRIEMRSEFASVRAEFRSDIAALRTDTAKWIIGAVFINALTMVGLVAAVWQFFHK